MRRSVLVELLLFFLSHATISRTAFSLSTRSSGSNNLQNTAASTRTDSIKTSNYTSEVLEWLDSEGISWHDARQEIPALYLHHCPTSTFITLDKSRILLHLIPTPTALEECLPPTLNRKLTAWVGLVDANITKIVHLHQDIWIAKNDIVKSRLLVQSLAKQPQRMFARKTTARKFNATDARAFLTENHLWGATKAQYYYGLFQTVVVKGKRGRSIRKEQLVAVATFSKCRKVERSLKRYSETYDTQTYDSYELIRFCSLKECTVVGGISKLLKQFVRDRKEDSTENNNPMDIVTMVDRDWGSATGWEHSLDFRSMSILDPLVMAVNPQEPGKRRYLVGAGLQHADDDEKEDCDTKRRQKQSGLKPRLGLPRDVSDDLNAIDNPTEAMQRLAQYNFYPVYDAGVERLYMIVDNPRPDKPLYDAFDETKMRWRTAIPNYTTRYYSINTGIVSLLENAASGLSPLDDPIHQEMLESWRNSTAASAKPIFEAPSSMDPNATIEVCERDHGWTTMRFVKPNTHKVSSIYHGMYKVDPTDGSVQPEIVIQEHLKTMGALALMTGHYWPDDDKYTRRFLHFGYGPGTLVRFLAHHIEDSEHDVVELDRAVVEAVKKTTHELPNVGVFTKNAIEHLRIWKDQVYYDCICIDVFDENDHVPPQLYSRDNLLNIRENFLFPDGIMVWNFHSGGKRRTKVMDEASKAIAREFGWNCFCWVPSIDSTPTGGNAILLASNYPLPKDGDGNFVLTDMALKAQTKYGLSFDAVARVSKPFQGVNE